MCMTLNKMYMKFAHYLHEKYCKIGIEYVAFYDAQFALNLTQICITAENWCKQATIEVLALKSTNTEYSRNVKTKHKQYFYPPLPTTLRCECDFAVYILKLHLILCT